MAYSARTLRIIVASVVALVMVGGSYALSGPVSFLGINVADAQTSAELLREYAAKDSDTDNLPDWQEALYGTDPYNAESFQAGIKDGEAVAQGLIAPKVQVAAAPEATDLATVPGTAGSPNSLTDLFAQTLLKQYLTNRGDTPPTNAEIADFVEEGIATLVKTSSPVDTYALKDTQTSGSTGPLALKAYLASVENAFSVNTIPSEKNELLYFSDAMNGDATALPHIRDISSAYKDIATAMLKIPVPTEARQAHLRIVNALAGMSTITADMGAMEGDPLRALMGIGLYERQANGMVDAFASLDAQLIASQIVVTGGESGYAIFKTAKDGTTIRAERAAQ